VKYSRSEEVASVDEIRHDIAREALRLCGIRSASRSSPSRHLRRHRARLVELLLRGAPQRLARLSAQRVSPSELAEEACGWRSTSSRAPSEAGSVLAAFGGLTVSRSTGGARSACGGPGSARASSTTSTATSGMFSTQTQRDRATSSRPELGLARATGRRSTACTRSARSGHRVLEAVEAGDLTEVGCSSTATGTSRGAPAG
jgi:D-glycero-alpha-D-manno-heptose-7-phosphate kinase